MSETNETTPEEMPGLRERMAAFLDQLEAELPEK